MKPIKFYGVYKDYLWGGNKMREKYSIETEISPIAESWVLSVHPDGMSVIKGGEKDGLSLADYIKENPAVLGSLRKSDELPVLIKFIDAADNLSVQVHPNDEQARLWENQNGKTEMWYVIEADEGAKITCGVKEKITKEELSSAIKNNTVEALLNTVPSKKGDVFFVEAGTVHAIGKGNLIAEIQQNSNVTYRLYDYDRRDKNGNTRELHIEKGVAASNTDLTESREVPTCADGTRLIAACEYFCVKEVPLTAEYTFLADQKSYHALLQTHGESLVSTKSEDITLKAGECLFIPAGMGEYSLKGSGTVLLTSNN